MNITKKGSILFAIAACLISTSLYTAEPSEPLTEPHTGLDDQIEAYIRDHSEAEFRHSIFVGLRP